MVLNCFSEGQLLLKSIKCHVSVGHSLDTLCYSCHLHLPATQSILALDYHPDLHCLLRSGDSSLWLLPESTLEKGQVSQAV